MTGPRLTRRSVMATAAALTAAGLGPRQALAATEVGYWHHFTGQSEVAGFEAVAKLFAGGHPDVALMAENIPSAEFMAKLTNAIVAGSQPDTAMMNTERFPDIHGMGSLVDLTDKVKGWARAKDFPDSRWQAVTVDGRIYGVPMFAFVNWMYYRKDWFDEAGIAGPPTTMEEFLETAVKMTDPSKNRFGFGLRGGSAGQNYVIDMFKAYGSPIVKDGKAAIDKPKALEALRFYTELHTKHKVTPPSAPNDSYRQIMEAFRSGQTAMMWHTTGSLGELSQSLKPVEQFMSAVRPKGPVTWPARYDFGYNGVLNAKKLDAAWEWVSFWGEPDAEITLLQTSGFFPPSTAVRDDPRIKSQPILAPAFVAMEQSFAPDQFPGGSAWATGVVLPEFQKILVGQTTPEAALDAMIRGLEKTLG